MREFDARNNLKKKIHNSDSSKNVFISEKEIRFAHLGVNIWSEQNGTKKNFLRPVLILKKLGSLFLTIPMTTKWKDNQFYHTLPFHYFNKTSRLIFTQIKSLDKKRFSHKIWKLSNNDFFKAKEKLKAFLSL